MARKGRPAKSTAAHKAEGTYRADRHGSRGVRGEVLERPPAPRAGLGRTGTAKWRSTAKELVALGLLTSADLDALEMYCRAWQLHADAEAAIKKDGAYHATEKGTYVRHPAMLDRKAAQDMIRRYQIEFGLTPSASAGVPARKQKQSNVASRRRA